MAVISTQRDRLRVVANEIAAWCRSNDFTLVAGSVEERSQIIGIHCKATAVSSWRQVLDEAKVLRCSIAVIDAYELDDADLETLRAMVEKGSASEAEKELDRVVQAAEEHKGEVGRLNVECLNQETGLLLVQEWEEDWYGSAIDMLQSANEGEAGDETPRLAAVTLRDLAARVAEDPKFQEAKVRQRRHAAEQVLGSDFPANELDQEDLIDRASAIYDVDIKPKADRDLRAKILALQDTGMTRSRIAAQLGLSAKRLAEIMGA